MNEKYGSICLSNSIRHQRIDASDLKSRGVGVSGLDFWQCEGVESAAMKTLLFILTVLLLTATPTEAQESIGKDSLKGLKGVYVLVESMDADVENLGLRKTLIQTDAELRLRKAGVVIVTNARSFDADTCTLYINVGTKDLDGNSKGLFAFHVSVNIDQMVRLERRPTMEPIPTRTYQVVSSFGTVGVDHLREDLRALVNDQVDVFINDFLAANPKP